MFQYERIYNELKEKILGKEYAEGEFLPSEHDLGIVLGTDRTTLRKSLKMLADDGLIEKQAGKGSLVIDRANRRFAPAANNNNKKIAFLLPKGAHDDDRITQPFYSKIFYTLETECKERGYSIIYSTLNTKEEFLQFSQNSGCIGMAFVSNIARNILDFAVEKGIPSVLINNCYDRMASVISDGTQGTYLACKHLLGHGHRDIYVLSGIQGYQTTIDRLHGCTIALREAGIDLRADQILQGDWEYESGYNAMKRLLESGKKRPTAVVAFNDYLAIGAMCAICEKGLSVPNDISLVGFDNMKEAAYSIPELTTVDSGADIIAHVAADVLFRQIDGISVHPYKIMTPVKLVERASVAHRA